MTQLALPDFARRTAKLKTLLAIDFNKHACATYAANFPDADVRCARVEDVGFHGRYWEYAP